MKAPPRGLYELKALDEHGETADVALMPLEDEVSTDVDETTDEVRYVREDCEGILE